MQRVHPRPGVSAIRDRLACYNEAVNIVVVGERWARPITPFSEMLRPRP
ncbi:hypothetical protein [Streptomyces vastus]